MQFPNRFSALPGGMYAAPNQTYGYYRGAPLYPGGTLSGQPGQGPEVQGIGEFPAGQGLSGELPTWSPTLTYIFVLVGIEMLIFGCLARLV